MLKSVFIICCYIFLCSLFMSKCKVIYSGFLDPDGSLTESGSGMYVLR